MGQAKRRGTFEQRKANPLGTGYRKQIGSRFHRFHGPTSNSQGLGTSIGGPGVSVFFWSSKRRSKGRRAVRHLRENKVMIAQLAAANPEHQEKFLSRSQKFGKAMREAITRRDA